jgi:hypothetical protein
MAPTPAVDTPAIPGLGPPPEPLRPRGRPPVARDRAKGFEVKALIDYGDPDALKKAILHYEILGRPLALRDPLERTTTL